LTHWVKTEAKNHHVRLLSMIIDVFRAFVLLVALLGNEVSLFAQDRATPEYKRQKYNKGDKYYTQFSLFREGGVVNEYIHRTTNYRVGDLVPVNTPVRLLSRDDDTIELRLPDGAQLCIENIEDYSGESIEGIFRRTLGPQPVDLSVFTQEERGAIFAGEVEVGMTRAAVLIALGYPPKHKTPSLQGNRWRYWKGRTDTFLVIFEGDKVKAIKD
jgi:hypothetical protein